MAKLMKYVYRKTDGTKSVQAYGAYLPKEAVQEAGFDIEKSVQVSAEHGKIVLTQVAENPALEVYRK